MNTTTTTTIPVIIRKFPEGDLIALFPTVPGTSDPGTCLSYATVGQHGVASVDIPQRTKPATTRESRALLKELCRIGYKPRLVKRFTATHRRARIAALAY